ncbi:MAG: pantoate--beta-alanine ligase [Pseudomonadota bacterium]
MQIITNIPLVRQEADCLRKAGKRIVLVPTMGCLHEGHLSLMRLGRKEGDHLVVSIFVNPTQFGPTEDFEAYPRDFDRDCDMAESVGVDTVFAPETRALYGNGYQTYVTLERLPLHLCGKSRPSHFRGVASVVAKLLNIVKPHTAVFGEKDRQQLVIIRRMAEDLNFDVKIVGVPIVRERDGLAMSSRNLYLSKEERASATVLFQVLQTSQKLVEQGERSPERIIKTARELILSRSHTRIDYISICDPETLEDVDQIDKEALMALAVYVGKARLIDNAILCNVS